MPSIRAKKARRHFRRTVRRNRVTLVLTVSDTPHRENVYVDVRGWGQEAWADWDGYLLGSTWESYGNGRIWNMLTNEADLPETLHRMGYTVDCTSWSEPEPMPEQATLPGHPCPVCDDSECEFLEHNAA